MKTKTCKSCGVVNIESNAKKCPNCGAKLPVSVFKKWWFWLIIAVVILYAIGSSNNSSTSSDRMDESETPIYNNNPPIYFTYEVVDIDKMILDLEENALRAEKNYDGKYVEITGKIARFDSNGSYITIESVYAGEYNFDTIKCYIGNSKQRDSLLKKNVGDTVTIRGRIKDVNEISGYSLYIDEVK